MRRFFLALLVLFLVSTVGKADPVAITGGTILFNNTQGQPFTVTGEGTIINGSTSSLSLMLGGNVPFTAGQPFVIWVAADTQDGEIGGNFPITVAGITYSSGHAILLQIGSSALSINLPVDPQSGYVVTAPFSLVQGFVGGYPGGICCTIPFFSNRLTGEGTQILTFSANPVHPNVYRLDSFQLTFGPVAPGVTVQAVPEPTTMLLLGSGLVGVAVKFRRRRRTT